MDGAAGCGRHGVATAENVACRSTDSSAGGKDWGCVSSLKLWGFCLVCSVVECGLCGVCFGAVSLLVCIERKSDAVLIIIAVKNVDSGSSCLVSCKP